MLIGAHVSTAGGLAEAPKHAASCGCEVFQFFSRSPRGGSAPALTPDLLRDFRAACEVNKQVEWYIHTPYYINLASEKVRIRQASIRVIREELERGSLLKARYVMTHLGSAKDVGEERARNIVIQGLTSVLDGYRGTCELLIEISAGAGMIIGDTFEELHAILKALKSHSGICYDTQHAFASGYDIRTSAAVETTLDAFDAIIGLEHLKLSHCNDSQSDLGSHKDRHEHIGKGKIGMAGFHALMHNSRFSNINLVLETPSDGSVNDIATLKRLRSGHGNT
ncbi:MAG: deoxyribonuclease IV [bacterium]